MDDYAPNCGLAGGAPDVVYSFVPPFPGELGVSLCGSSYDTEVYVYADVAGNIIACNDDSCGLQSELWVPVARGHTYYVIVDGYSHDGGAYQILVDLRGKCDVFCPPGGLLEGEPLCGDNYYDSYNGGCNSVPPVFLPLPLQDGLVVCGQYGGFNYAGLSYRDTDWYQITVPVAQTVSWTVRGETDTMCGIIDGNAGCPVTSFYAYAYGPCVMEPSASATLSAGTWWLWVGTLNFGSAAGPCGQRYDATLHCSDCSTVAVEPSTWGRVKNRYR